MHYTVLVSIATVTTNVDTSQKCTLRQHTSEFACKRIFIGIKNRNVIFPKNVSSPHRVIQNVIKIQTIQRVEANEKKRRHGHIHNIYAEY